MYESSLVEPQEVENFIQTVNEENYKIVSAVYLSDSSQVLFIVEKPSKPQPFLKAKEGEKEE